jgi:hypothetical protein
VAWEQGRKLTVDEAVTLALNPETDQALDPAALGPILS